jgi:hypothetical protein
MEKAVLNVVDQKMEIHVVGGCRLSALVAEFTLEVVAAVFASHGLWVAATKKSKKCEDNTPSCGGH